MGLFDKLLKEGAEVLKDVASEENKQKAAELFGSIRESLNEHAKDFKEAMEEYKKEEGNTSKNDDIYTPVEDGMTCKERIIKILNEEFSSYTYKENVSPTTIGGTGRFMDYSIVVYDNEKPKLIIMLIGKTTTAHREYRFSRKQAEAQGINFINFVNHFPNTPQYISERLHKYL